MSWKGASNPYQEHLARGERHDGNRIRHALEYFERQSVRGHQIRQAPEAIESCLQFIERTFVPHSVVDRFFTTERITALLLEIYGPEIEVSVDAGEIRVHYITVFLILLTIGEGSSIVDFVRQQKYQDETLPFSFQRSADGACPHDSPLATDAASYAFEKEQWRFFPYRFEPGVTRLRLSHSWILPITSVQVLKPGTDVTITKIEIHEEYDELRWSSTGTDVCHTYVLKSSPMDDIRRPKYHQAEVMAYTLIRKSFPNIPDQIVRFFGEFFQGRIANIVLEYADEGTLEDYFNSIPPPVTRDEQMDFWTTMRELVLGLQNVHRFAPGIDVPVERSFQDYHQDLQLSNILVFRGDATSPYKYQFKIADLGTSYYLRRHEYQRSESGEGQPGVTTYGSPESWRIQREASNRRIDGKASDVWSLACIFSVATTWAVGGSYLINRYANERRAARKRLGVEDADCFHDNFKVLPTVERWHRRLVEYARKNDDITVRIWPRVLKRVLLEPAWSRGSVDQLQNNAAELCTRGGWAEAEPQVDEICDQEFSWEALILAASQQARKLPSAPVGDEGHHRSCQKSKRGVMSLPYMSVKALLKYGKSRSPETEQKLKESMKGRDVVFLVDDSKSMLRNHWDEVTRLFEGLAVFLEDSDEDGMALRFTVSSGHDQQGKAEALIKTVKNMDQRRGVPSDPTSAFSKCFQDHKKSIREGKRKKNTLSRKLAKPLSIIFLTDGVWGPQTDLASVVIDVVGYLDEPPKTGFGTVGIQIIRFGRNEVAKATLRSLGDLHEDGTTSRDIVDTVASTGNVWRMILGPTNKSFDEDEKTRCTCGLETNRQIRRGEDPYDRFESTSNVLLRSDSVNEVHAGEELANKSQKAELVVFRREPGNTFIHRNQDDASPSSQDLDSLLVRGDLTALQNFITEQRKLPKLARNKRIESCLTLSLEDLQIVEILKEAMDAALPASDIKIDSQESGEAVSVAENPLASATEDLQEPETAVSAFEDQLTRGMDIAIPDPGLELESNLSPKARRITWTCVCGVELFDDYIELVPGSLDVLEQQLRGRPPKTPFGGWWRVLWNIRLSASGSATHGPAGGTGFGGMSTPSKSHPSQNTSGTHDFQSGGSGVSNAPQSVASVGGRSTLVAATIQYLLLCLPTASTAPKLHQEQLVSGLLYNTVCDDEQLFHLLRNIYYAQKPRLHSLFSLRRVTRVSLTQFYVNLARYVDVRPHHKFCGSSRDDCECMPPESRLLPPIAEYTCNPLKPNWRPPIAHNYLTHHFHEPGHSSGMTWVLNQVPKRTCGQLVPVSGSQPTVGWGLGLDDGWDLKKIIVMCQILGFGIISFALVYSFVYKAAGDAFTISGFWVTLIGIFLGYVSMTQSSADLT